MDTDTICAVATPPGQGGVGIVRLSGPGARTLAGKLAGEVGPPRLAVYRTFRDREGRSLDAGLLLHFPAPHSFTGEDVVEFQGHGGPVLLDGLLRELIALGARLARPGEFSERAFLNGRMDLTQAEAIADLISARSEAGARAAMRSLEGAFSRRVHELVAALTALRVRVEALIDFPDEDLEGPERAVVARELEALRGRLDSVREQASLGRLVTEGMTVVIAGAPNAGKSSLLNALAGSDLAIVTEVAGTTRDLVHGAIRIDGIPLNVVDTAGLRVSSDPVETEGIRRAREAMEAADAILLVVDDTDPAQRSEVPSLPAGVALVRAINKIDLSGRPAGPCPEDAGAVAVCARDGRGLDALRERLRLVGGHPGEVGEFAARRRHLSALDEARGAIVSAAAILSEGAGIELVAEELRLAQDALGSITGAVSADELLGAIFSTFCIGK